MSKVVHEKISALLQKEATKKHSNRIFLGVQTKDKSVDYKECAGSESGNISQDDSFFVASITKMYTATVIFQLIDEGKLSLDDHISKHLPEEMTQKIHVYKGTDYSSKITIDELLHQTSGLSDFFLQKDKSTGKTVMDSICVNDDHEWNRMDYLNMAKTIPPMFPPSYKSGKRSFYSDTNYQLLGAIIEFVTDMSIAENFAQRIFQPLHLSDKTYVYDHKHPAHKDRQDPVPINYKAQELNIPKIMSSFPADGGVVSTMDDLLVFLKAYFDGQLFDKKHHDVIQSQWNTVVVPPLQYGRGLMRFKVPKWMTLYCFDMPPLYGHSGSSGSFAFYAPHKEAFVVGSFNQVEQESRPFQFMMQVLACLD